MIHSALLVMLIAAAADAPPSKSEILEKVQAIAELESLSFVAEVKEDKPAMAKHPAVVRTIRVKVVMADGAKFRVEGFQGEKSLGTIVSDGTQVTEYDPDQNQWTRYPMPVFDKDYYFKGLIIDDNVLSHFADSWVDKSGPRGPWLEQVVSANETVVLPAREVGERTCVGLRHTRNELMAVALMREKNVLYFDAKSYLPARETKSFSGTILLLRNQHGSEETDYLDVMANPNPSADAFAFTPPADAKYIAPNVPQAAPGGPGANAPK